MTVEPLRIRCIICGRWKTLDDLAKEAMRRYEARFREPYTQAHERNREAAHKNYAPIYSEVQSQWRSLGCVALEGGTHL